MSPAIRFTAVYAAVLASHAVGDYWVQRDADAAVKGQPGPEGRAACARHVATYTAAQSAAVILVNRRYRLGLKRRRIAAALALQAATHYTADRAAGRWHEKGPGAPLVVRLARATGHGPWLDRAPELAGPLMDQAWHHGWNAIAAAIATDPKNPTP